MSKDKMLLNIALRANAMEGLRKQQLKQYRDKMFYELSNPKIEFNQMVTMVVEENTVGKHPQAKLTELSKGIRAI